MAHVLPLDAGARRGAARRGACIACAPVAAVVVRRAAAGHAAALEAIAEPRRLTPEEARVPLGVFGVGGVPRIAEAFGPSGATVRTRPERVFEKAGAGWRADLVEMASPLLR